MSITTIIVNYNAGETLGRCVRAVVKSTEYSRIVIADNASQDRSAQALRNQYGDRQAVTFLFNPSNLGFGRAINAVARQAESDYILILNPDCILEATAIEQLKAAMDSDPSAGMAGPAVLDDQGKLQRATVRRFPDPWKSLMTTTGLWRLGKWMPVFNGVEASADIKQTAEVDAVSGACMFVRRSAFEQAGWMDEKYAMHCEDIDLMYRLALENWHCLYVPGAECVHLQGLSSRSRPTWVHYQKHQGMLRFYNKYQADKNTWPMRALVRLGVCLRFLLLWPLILLKR